MELILLIVGIFLWKRWNFNKSGYFEASGNSFVRTILNRGDYGEYLTYKCLNRIEGYNRILTNVYLPKEDGSTTEIDLIMISQKGIFVFESKNYSGWIFGNESSQMWTQTLKGGTKNRFYNPIWQNKGHISVLNQYFGGRFAGKFHSYIVFSERCTLKDVNIRSRNVYVVKRNELFIELKSHYYDAILTLEEVDMIHNALEKYCNVEDEIKQRHKQAVHH